MDTCWHLKKIDLRLRGEYPSISGPSRFTKKETVLLQGTHKSSAA